MNNAVPQAVGPLRAYSLGQRAMAAIHLPYDVVTDSAAHAGHRSAMPVWRPCRLGLCERFGYVRHTQGHYTVLIKIGDER